MECSGANERIAKLEERHKEELARTRASLVAHVAERVALVTKGREKDRERQLLMLRLFCAQLLNQDADPGSKRFTFWSRRSKALQSDLDALRKQLK